MKIAVLDNLRSVHNVGSIFRTCNAVGVDKIYLCGTTPTPLDHKGLKRKDFAKVALGAEETLTWEYCESTAQCVKKLKDEGCYILSLEQDENAIDYKAVDILDKKDIAFILGNEVEGITKDILKSSDVILEIPMLGTKESLNVTIAAGIVFYRVLGI
jgi:23S rRNA (guanosine2251-2'-O)-methyltransferase